MVSLNTLIGRDLLHEHNNSDFFKFNLLTEENLTKSSVQKKVIVSSINMFNEVNLTDVQSMNWLQQMRIKQQEQYFMRGVSNDVNIATGTTQPNLLWT